MKAVLLPGFNGAADQPILMNLERRLALIGVSCARKALSRGKPTPGLEREIAQLTTFIEGAPVVLAGRSFGGRVCARYAAARPARALILLGFPLRPPGKPRPQDEAALLAVTCPTLIVQGDADELGPLNCFRPLLRKNPALTLQVVKDAGHSFGRHEGRALDDAAAWLETVLAATVTRATSRGGVRGVP